MKKVLMLLLAVSLFTGCVRYSNGKPVESKEETKKEEVKKEEKPKKNEKPLTTEENVKKIIIDKIGKINNMKKDRIVEIKVNEIEPGKEIVNLKLNASENLTNNMTKKGMWKDSKSVLEPISKIKTVDTVNIMWMFPLVDQYGKTEDGKIMSFSINRETLDKIKWDRFLTDNIPNVSTDYFEHPALKK